MFLVRAKAVSLPSGATSRRSSRARSLDILNLEASHRIMVSVFDVVILSVQKLMNKPFA